MKNSGIIFLIFYSLLISAIYLFHLAERHSFVIEVITFVTPLIGIYFSWAAVKYFGFSTSQGKSSFFIALHLLLFWLGDVVWGFYQEAVVSFADVIWLLAYPVLGIGIYFGIKVIRPDFFKSKRNIGLMALTAMLLLSGYLTFFPNSWDPHVSIIENMVTYGYTLVDLLLITLLIYMIGMIYTIRKGDYSKTWVAMLLAVISLLVADIYYAQNYLTYVAGDLIDLVWDYSYLFFALSQIVLISNVNKLALSLKKKS